MNRLHCLSLRRLFLLLWLAGFTTSAPTSCSFSCPSADENGYTLITSPYATPYDGSYSIFDCVYALSGTPIEPHTCRYYKSNGLNALGYLTTACPTQAIPCSSNYTPEFSTPDNIEIPPWVGIGNDLLYYKENHPNPNPPAP